MKKDLAPHPRNTDETVAAQSEPTGGLPRFERLKEDMAKAMVAKDVPKMAEIFRQTCPGDWNRGYGAALGGMLNKVVNEGLLPPEKTYRKIDVQQYVILNWKSAEVADLLVDTFELPKPGGKPCVLWDDRDWLYLMCRETSGFEERYERVLGHWWRAGFVPRPLFDQGPKSPRFGKYLAAAVAMSDLSQQELDAVLVDMTR
ncbi:hypothetical protein CKAH01_16011 [Colletotrichum kahawae]|uniref:Uncharacterized protein n=1 Tax=Colletotrichum kahawae TaxID=34407 RepID=A0AAD9YEW2_COLKA|nr:hypothetical protein CKAH01_16011 [Colletotrichum kahawae]